MTSPAIPETDATANDRFQAILAATLTDRSWPFSEVCERLLNMLVVERVRFAF